MPQVPPVTNATPVPCISSFGDLPAPARFVEMKAPAASGNRRDQKQH
jgi:hypothetical protein